jgi:hypothetical protein
VRWRGGPRGGVNGAGANPHGGAYIDYWLGEKPADSLTLQFVDAAGKVIRTFSSSAKKTDSLKTSADTLASRTDAALADSLAYMPGTERVPMRVGGNRFVWDLQVEDAKRIGNTVIDEGHLGGPMVPPGSYTVRLITGKDTLSRTLAVVADPRIKTTTAELSEQYVAALRVRDRINEIAENVARTEDFQKQLDGIAERGKDQPWGKKVDSTARAVRKRFEEVREELYEIGCHVDQCTLDMPVKLYNWFITLNAQVQQGDYAPTKQHGEIYTDLNGKLQVQLRKLQALEDNELAALNRLLQESGVPALFVPPRKPVS